MDAKAKAIRKHKGKGSPVDWRYSTSQGMTTYMVVTRVMFTRMDACSKHAGLLKKMRLRRSCRSRCRPRRIKATLSHQALFTQSDSGDVHKVR